MYNVTLQTGFRKWKTRFCPRFRRFFRPGGFPRDRRAGKSVAGILSAREELFGAEAREAVRKATGGRIKPQTVARMMTALRRAGAASRESRNEWGLFEPTDERREAVEREADKLNAHKPKEAANA